MRYSIVIDQYHSLEWGLVMSEAFLFSYLIQLPTWAQRFDIGGIDYYFANRHKIIEELPLVTDKPDTAYRLLKKLQKKGLIDYQKYMGKDCVRMLPKGKVWNCQKAPKKATKNSDSNPKKLGFKSENDKKLGFKSEKTRIQIRKNSDSNPTDKYYNIISTTIDEGETLPKKTKIDLGEISKENKKTPPQVAPAPPNNYLDLEKELMAHFAANEGEREMMIGRALFRGDLATEIMKFCEYYHENKNLLRKPIRNIIPQLTSWLRKSAQFQRNDQRNNSGKKRTNNNLISENELWELDAQLESEGY